MTLHSVSRLCRINGLRSCHHPFPFAIGGTPGLLGGVDALRVKGDSMFPAIRNGCAWS